MTSCKECLLVAVCAKCAATGGHVRECDYFVRDRNVPNWIPVTERLPEEWVPVLAWSMYGFCEAAVYLGIPGEWRVTWNHAMLEKDTITHWMPLPEPPKEVE